MEAETVQTPGVANMEKEWFSEEFISSAIERYLKDNGYKIHKDVYNKMPDKVDNIITASKFFTKEIIEVKGYPHNILKHGMAQAPRSNTQVHHAKKWFSEALLNSFMNFGKYYSNESAMVAMALPNVERYKTIIEKVQDYFSQNNLYFKIYLVDESGDVEISNLNKKFTKENS